MKKFISWWMGLAIASAAIAIDTHTAISNNQNPTGEQLLVSYFIIVYFSIFALVCVGAHIENIIYKNK